MLQIKNLTVKLAQEQTEILHGVNLSIYPGGVYLLQGRNGSGKSSLASTIAGNPSFEISDGQLLLENEDYPDFILDKVGVKKSGAKKTIKLNDLGATERSLLGIFLAHQYPLEVPGVNLSSFLRMVYNAHHAEPASVFQFRKLLKEKAELINFPNELLDRNLNEGFSGGEKKKAEILQMAILEPRYAILDETDSGLDKHAIKDVFAGIANLHKQNKQMALLVITHYDKVLEFLKPDHQLTMEKGLLTQS